MKLSTSVVSHHVSKLEERLGVALLYRSTRSLSLTAEGAKILPAARQMVVSADQAMDALADDLDQLVGALRVTIPTFGMHGGMHRAIWAFAGTHPMVALTLHSSDRQVDLVREGFDLGIRLGNLSDSRLMTRRIGTFGRALVAAPSHLEARGNPRSPKDLSRLEFISYAMLPSGVLLEKGGERVHFEPENTRIEVDTVAAAKAAVLEGLGIQRFPVIEVDAELQAGELVEVLPGWRPPDLGVYAVWPDGGAQKKLTRRLVEFLVDR